MNTLECARFLRDVGLTQAAIALYEESIREMRAQTIPPSFPIGPLIRLCAEAARVHPGEKIPQIKFVRERSNLGLKEAKEAVEAITWNILPSIF